MKTDKAGKSKKIFAKKNAFIMLIGVLAILIGILVYGIMSRDTEPVDSRFPKQKVVMEQLSYEALHAKVSQLELSKQYKEARELVKYQKYYDENQQARFLYVSLIINQGDTVGALKALRTMESNFGESPRLAANIAQYADDTGDKELAVRYYKKAITLTKKDKSNPVRGTEVKEYEKKLKQLEGK